MLVHLGREVIADAREVVAILDGRRLSRTADARALLARVGCAAGEAPPPAVVVTTRGVLGASVSVATAARRIERLTADGRMGARRKGRQDAGSGR
ncbi:MAG: hypothetical protein QN120_11695 [Armatimonadota bacterium]|nr:hypothetical protein [Armatimonadota bacterium]